ncbi:zinc-dependent alcohol dehydrogenase family protein [Acinetobacter sichuanensis]|uniref:zinc-dependent alcohol dehydrogenase family protein n=1 Tax=Acinetobacter sichuanensis TaxID=2136183 RepID=UPI00280E1694|nr:zinc-dependent alcohol dehydrogenase family protein [Acinetobacter sichuanensis]MDQ9020551.1 zinc-dependent alcohol dehydrogenase family protein [Acinetobacter sichuanensis]
MSKTVMMRAIGAADVLQIEDVQISAPKKNEVQISVHAIGLNRAEIMYRTGNYVIEPTFPSVLGYEAAGVVTALGEDASDFKIGDFVSVIPSFGFDEYGTYGELINIPMHAVVKHPENLTFEQAAASWMMFVTAYGALVHLGNLQKEQYVVIGAASSSVGVAAIQIANMLGATPVALTRTSAKKQQLIDLGAKYVISTEEQDIVSELNRITSSQGVNMAFDPVGGPTVGKIMQAMAPQGMFFQYGALDTRDIQMSVMDVLGKHLTLRGYELFEITTDPKALAQAKQFVYQGLASGELLPLIDQVFKFDDIQKAHEYMEKNAQIGKIVVNVQ